MQEIGRTLANHRRSQETSQLPRTEGLQNLNPNSPVFSWNIQQDDKSDNSLQVNDNNGRRDDVVLN